MIKTGDVVVLPPPVRAHGDIGLSNRKRLKSLTRSLKIKGPEAVVKSDFSISLGSAVCQGGEPRGFYLGQRMGSL
jgi:hypothetical protein